MIIGVGCFAIYLIVVQFGLMSSKRLTGNKRIVHDCCVDLFNTIQKWNSMTCDSNDIVDDICILKQNVISHLELQNEESMNSDYSKEYSQLENLSLALQAKMENLSVLLKKLENILSQLNAVVDLLDFKQSDESGSLNSAVYKPFKIWTLPKYCTVIEEIVHMYKEEFCSKSCISKEICIVNDKSTLVFFDTCWKYEPQINKNKLDMLLDKLKCELNLFPEDK